MLPIRVGNGDPPGRLGCGAEDMKYRRSAEPLRVRDVPGGSHEFCELRIRYRGCVDCEIGEFYGVEGEFAVLGYAIARSVAHGEPPGRNLALLNLMTAGLGLIVTWFGARCGYSPSGVFLSCSTSASILASRLSTVVASGPFPGVSPNPMHNFDHSLSGARLADPRDFIPGCPLVYLAATSRLSKFI